MYLFTVTGLKRCLGRILNVIRIDNIRNKEIRKLVTLALNNITQQQVRWFNHITRMPADSIPQKALKSRSNKRPPKQQPETPKDWINAIIKALR
jgi:hypothetical protein